MRVLVVSTSAAAFTGGETGVWLEELATPYFIFKAAGFELTLASEHCELLPPLLCPLLCLLP